MSYSNGRTLSLQYDNRLRVTDWNVPGVLGWQYSYTDVGENTGRVMFAKNTASSTAGGQRDDTLDRSYDYDHLGRLIVSHSGYEARLHMNRQQPGDPTTYGPYSQAYGYDQLGNMTVRYGWGGWDAGYVNWAPSYTNNRLNTNPATGAAMLYDASGNLTNDGYQSYTYDATGQQAYASGTALTQSYDGNGVRAKKTEGGATTYYLRSSVLGGQVIAEINSSGAWTRGYVYAGGQMIAVQQQGAVYWMHEDPVTKSKRVTDIYGSVVSTIDLDPWGGETATGSNQAFQPHRFTNYERDANSGDEAMMRRYTGKWHRFYQPDPYEGSYDLSDPQSFNRYAYTKNDPVNFTDPTGLQPNICTVFDEHGACVIYSGYTPAENSLRAWARYANSRSLLPGGGTGGEPHGGGGKGGGTGGGTAGKTPQNPAPTPTPPTDCQKFADMVGKIANETIGKAGFPDDVQNFMNGLATTFTEFYSATATDIARFQRFGAGNRLANTFGSSGFAGRYYEPPPGNNQVRHATAGLVVGYAFAGLGNTGLNRMNARENPNDPIHGVPDINLNGQTVPMGARLAGGNGRVLARGLADWIRNTLCAK